MLHQARLRLRLVPRCRYGHTEVGVFFFCFFPPLPSAVQEPRKGKRAESFIHRLLDFLLLHRLTSRYVTLDALECLK